MFDCILLMAGVGKRTNLKYNKINYVINGKKLYVYSLEKFLSIKEVNKVILVVNENEYDEFKKLTSDKIIVTVGGKERQDSVYNGLKCVTTDVCLIHDAARPNVRVSDILKVYEETLKYKSSVLAVKCNNAIKKVKDGMVEESVDRNDYYLMQTPQGVDTKLMIKALESINTLIYDDVEALEKVFNIKAKIVEGSYDNIKVTTESDLKYIEFLLGEENE